MHHYFILIKEKQSLGLSEKDYENIANGSNFIHRLKAGCEVMLGTSLYTRKKYQYKFKEMLTLHKLTKSTLGIRTFTETLMREMCLS